MQNSIPCRRDELELIFFSFFARFSRVFCAPTRSEDEDESARRAKHLRRSLRSHRANAHYCLTFWPSKNCFNILLFLIM
jgi:hypothetical protein